MANSTPDTRTKHSPSLGGADRSSLARAPLAWKRTLGAFLAVVTATSGACTPPSDADRSPERLYVATIHPLAEILREVVAERAQVVRLLPPGASPHAYEPRPSEVSRVSASTALFYGAPHLDEWATHLDATARLSMLDLLPEEELLPLAHAPEPVDVELVANPHFWMDPLAVRAVLPALAGTLCGIDPDGCARYRSNVESFSEQLSGLDREVREILAPYAGRAVVLAQPFLDYFLRRYGLQMAAVIEPAPGKEPSPRDVQATIRLVQESDVAVILAVSQLPARSASVVSESTGVPLVFLDPIGGIQGRQSYPELIRFNAWTLAQALR